MAAAGVASTATSSVVVGAVDDRKSDEDDPEALVVEKITDAVHISHFRRPVGGEPFHYHIPVVAGEHFRCSVIII